MNPSKLEYDPDPFFLHHNNHPSFSLHRQTTAITTSTTNNNNPSFSLLFHHSSPSSSSDSPQTQITPEPEPINETVSFSPKINPQQHMSTQFYTFNSESHTLMISCLLENRLATPVEIRSVTPAQVLNSWRSVWKDRNEDTAYLTAWKRIQDKLKAHIDSNGNRYLYFKNNSSQFVCHIDQWEDIVTRFHSNSNGEHVGVKETVDKIKKVWTVGAKFYGIPESFIRVCIGSCGVCSGGGGRQKRRRFEYNESMELPAREVANKLQMLAKKHNVVLCIRQKYIRYKPFMAEVKDYACHRAGEAGGGSSKKKKGLKREAYASKRCGCGFRIRAIVPIEKYNEKDKSFVYQDEGMAVFKMYAVHTGHEPGPLDGNARIMHRVVGHKRDNVDFESGSFVVNQVQDLKSEVVLLESRILKLPPQVLGSVSQELYHIVSKVKELGYDTLKSVGLDSDKTTTNSDVMLVGDDDDDDDDLPHWNDSHDHTLFVDDKDTDFIEEDDDDDDNDDDSFERTLGDVVPWNQIRDKDMIDESCKPDKWLNASEFDDKAILGCDDSKLTKPLSHHSLEDDVGLVDLHVESFYPENPKWYDSPCGLDSGTDCRDTEF